MEKGMSDRQRKERVWGEMGGDSSLSSSLINSW